MVWFGTSQSGNPAPTPPPPLRLETARASSNVAVSRTTFKWNSSRAADVEESGWSRASNRAGSGFICCCARAGFISRWTDELVENLNASRRRRAGGQKGHGMRVDEEDARFRRKSVKRVPCDSLTFLRRARFGDAILEREKTRARAGTHALFSGKPFLHARALMSIRMKKKDETRACVMMMAK